MPSSSNSLLKQATKPLVILFATVMAAFALRDHTLAALPVYVYLAILCFSSINILIPTKLKIKWATIIQLGILVLAYKGFEISMNHSKVYPFEWLDLSSLVQQGYLSEAVPMTNQNSNLWLVALLAVLCYFIPENFRLPWVWAVVLILFLLMLGLLFYQNGQITTWSFNAFNTAFFIAIIFHNSFKIHFKK